MKVITLKTEPISVNDLYRGKKFLTDNGKITKFAIGIEIKNQWKERPREGPIKIEIHFYIKNPLRDLDNMLKATLDCATGIIWIDDRQITEIHTYKHIDKENQRIEMCVME